MQFLSGSFQIRLLGEEIWDTDYVFEENMGSWYLRGSSKKKKTHFCLGEEIWDKNYIFQDIMGLWVPKTFVSKNDPLLSRNFSNLTTWEGRYGAKTAFFKITLECEYSKCLSRKNDLLLSCNFSNLTTWRGKVGQKLHFYITIFDPL